MVYGFKCKVKCKECSVISSFMWHNQNGNDFLCHDCHLNKKSEGRTEHKTVDTVGNGAGSSSSSSSVINGSISNMQGKTRNYNKIKSIVTKRKNATKSARQRLNNKDKGRRSIFKPKKVPKASNVCAESKTVNMIVKDGQCYQVGDVVSLVDASDKRIYYAQCVGFMIDVYAQKSVSYQWLLPNETWNSKEEDFVPGKFFLGPADNLFHLMSSVRFVCSMPPDYYKPMSSHLLSIKNKCNSLSVML